MIKARCQSFEAFLYQNGNFDISRVFSNWPGYFDFVLGIFRGLSTIGPSVKERTNISKEIYQH